MAGAAIRFDVRELLALAPRVESMLERLGESPPGDLLDEVGEVLEGTTQERFRTKTSPAGERWPKWRDDRYAERQRSRGGSLLSDEGQLRRSVTHDVGGDTLAVGTPDKRAPTLNYGDQRLAWGRVQATWPAREFLGLSDDDREDVAITVEEFVRREAA